MKKKIVYYPRLMKFLMSGITYDIDPSMFFKKRKYNAFRKKALSGIKTNIIMIPKNVIYIGKDAFAGCEANQVCYEGSEEEWSQIEIEEGNEILDPSKIRFNFKYENRKKDDSDPKDKSEE